MNTSIHSVLVLTAALGTSAIALHAAPLSFDFKDPKGVNNVIFKLDAPLESINGTGTGISGTITFDPANPGKTTGRIDLAVSSLKVGNPMMSDHLQGAMWMDSANHPTISFEAVKLANVKTEGAKTSADVTGKLTIRGVTKETTVPVTFTYLPGKLGDRVKDAKGDLLVVRAAFTIKRSDFGINAGKMDDKVAETIELTLSVAGAAPAA
jgi:polyisoprenoid-binding protein YceI